MERNYSAFCGLEANGVYLRARGFDLQGQRVGGIVQPQKVTLPKGACLVRLYGAGRKYGDWWLTPNEVNLVVDYFARGSATFSEGRKAAKGVLHATLTVLPNWSELAQFWISRLREPIFAYYGAGDVATTNGAIVKPASIIADGAQRKVRQIFIPNAATYKEIFEEIGSGATDSGLLSALRDRRETPLDFER